MRPTSYLRAILCLAAGFAPSPAVACLAGGAAVLELAVLAVLPDSICKAATNSSATVAIYLFAIWVHLGYLVWSVVVGVDRGMGAFGPRCERAGRMALAAGVVVGTSLYLASWCLFLRTGRFASFETVRFAMYNTGESWLASYLLTSEWRMVAVFLVGLGILLFAVPHGLRWVVTSRWPIYAGIGTPRIVACRVVAWFLVLCLVSVAHKPFGREASVMRRGVWRHAVAHGLNPALTWVAGLATASLREPVQPVLDARDLVPLSSPAPNASASAFVPAHSVLFVSIESLRHDVVFRRHQGQEITPHLNLLARRGLHFTRAYSQSTHSDYADLCIVSSLYPLRSTRHHFYRPNDPWPKTLIYDVLKPLGYATANISSLNEKWSGMDFFLASPNLDLYYDAERSQAATRLDERDSGFAHEVRVGAMRRGSLDDAHTVERAIAWVREQAALRKQYFLNVSFQNSHFPYTLPPGREGPFQPAEMDFDASFAQFPRDKVPVVRNAYYNAIHDCDQQLRRLTQALEECGELSKTILVVMGENGEAFYENGIVCHAGLPREPALRVALVIHAPDVVPPATVDYPTELIDVVPTVVSLLGLPAHPNFQGTDVLGDQRPSPSDRLLFFHAENPLAAADALLYQGRWKLIHDRAIESYELYDVEVDPRERYNLVERESALASRLRATLSHWRARQLAYYHFPQYYMVFHPPKAPRCVESPDQSDAPRSRETAARAQARLERDSRRR
jgi:arylsulfatase A-like enzyme